MQIICKMIKFEKIPIDKTSIPQRELNIDNKTRSNLFAWNGQFSPQFVETLLSHYAQVGDVVVDPFAGSGTTLCEAARKLIKQAFPNDQEKQKTAWERPLRRRRGAFGELIQIDGCPHYWFGLDNPPACLIGFIDDATSRITAARFFPTETSEGYMIVLLEHMRKYGIPVALYSDRHSVFTSNRDKFSRRESRTQFSRACNALGIDLILAQSPNAKGRVERMFRTLQCRWPLSFWSNKTVKHQMFFA